MNRPICCGKPATPYVKFYGKVANSFEEGFRCKRCGRIRIPFNEPNDPSYSNYMSGFEAIRLAGIEFDETFSQDRYNPATDRWEIAMAEFEEERYEDEV